MERGNQLTVISALLSLVLAMALVPVVEATPPVPVEAVTGCVKNGQMLIQAPERFKREKPLKITPCVNIPFDFAATEGKQIRARAGSICITVPSSAPGKSRLSETANRASLMTRQRRNSRGS